MPRAFLGYGLFIGVMIMASYADASPTEHRQREYVGSSLDHSIDYVITAPAILHTPIYEIPKVTYVQPRLFASKLPNAPFIRKHEWKSFHLKE